LLGAMVSALPAKPKPKRPWRRRDRVTDKPPHAVPSVRRTKRTNNPLTPVVHANTLRGRRCIDLIRAYMHALGNPTAADMTARVIAAAELVVLAEEMRAGALNNVRAKMGDVVRLQRLADMAVFRLGLFNHPNRSKKRRNVLHPKDGVSLSEYLGSEPAE
jgi:hypothetical protein